MAAVVDPFRAAADILDPPENPYLHDPAGWVKAKTGEHLWSAQVRIMESVRDNRRTAVPASHGPGKSFCAGRLASWWISVHPPGTAFVVTTAPSDTQVKAILWKEIKRAHRKGELPGTVLENAQWKVNGELVAIGRKPADHDEDAFQGIHERYILVILDEAGGIPSTIWEGASTLLTNDDARILAIGNPDHAMSQFATICEGADPTIGGMSQLNWNVLPIPVFSIPNYTGEPVPDDLRVNLTSRLWAEDFARQVGGTMLVDAHRMLLERIDAGLGLDAALGDLPNPVRKLIEGSPKYVSKVLARFPADSSDGVILWSWLNACTINPTDTPGPVQLGIDVGGSDTGDETVIYERVGMRAGRRWSIRSADPEVVLERCLEAIDEAQPEAVKIDSIGIGWGIMGSIRRERRGVFVAGVNVAEAASEKGRFLNLRSQIWWEVGRELAKDAAWDLSGITTESTLAELAAPQWHENKAGRIVVESKDDIRKRIGRSTDNADALLLAFYQAAEPAHGSRPARRVRTGADLATRRNGHRITK